MAVTRAGFDQFQNPLFGLVLNMEATSETTSRQLNLPCERNYKIRKNKGIEDKAGHNSTFQTDVSNTVRDRNKFIVWTMKYDSYVPKVAMSV